MIINNILFLSNLICTYKDRGSSRGVVVYRPDMWAFCVEDDIPDDEIREWKTVEVIGNIYED